MENTDSNKYIGFLNIGFILCPNDYSKLGNNLSIISLNAENFYEEVEMLLATELEHSKEKVKEYSGNLHLSSFKKLHDISNKNIEDYPEKFSNYILLKTELLKNEELKYFVCKKNVNGDENQLETMLYFINIGSELLAFRVRQKVDL